MATQTTVEIEVLDEDTLQPIPGTTNAAHNDANRLSFATSQPTTPSATTETFTILPKGRSIIVTIQLAGMNLTTSFTTGLLTIALPTMATELSLKRALLVWPTSAYVSASDLLR